MSKKSVRIVRLDIDELDDFSGVDAIALVEDPAIESNFMYFADMKQNREVFESYSDYPSGVSNNAKRGIELNEKVNNKCATQVGKVRAQQLAKKEPISVETIKRMYSYLSRAEVNYDESDTTSCGTISYLLWGGLAGKRWAESKLKELGLFEGDLDVSGLAPYINEPSGSLIVKLDEGNDTWHDRLGLADIGPRGGVKKSPKAPKSKTPGDGKKGSDKNPKGSAGTTRGNIKIPKRVEESLKQKSDDFNERYKEKLGYGVNIGMLKSVYQRGVGAYQTSHSPDVKSAEQWAQARVNAFLYLVKEGRPQNKKYTTDYDLLPTKHPKRVENSAQTFVDPRAGESEAEYIGRCVSVLQSEGYDDDQSLAICYADWRTRDFKEIDSFVEQYIEELFDFLGYVDGLPVYSTKEEAEEVAEIAGCKGHHEHKVGELTVFMPCESHDESYDVLLKEAHDEWMKSRVIDANKLSVEELDDVMDYLDSVAIDVNFSQDTFAGITGGKQKRNVGNSVSFLDTPGTKIRYRYVVNPSAPSNKSGNSRGFCKAMMARKDNVYRKEDINNASTLGVNRKFGPGQGGNPYNLFLYRGGNNCRHIWETVIFYESNGKWSESPNKLQRVTDLIKPRETTNPLEGAVNIGALGINLSKEKFADQQMLVAPAMIPDKMIYRVDEEGPYYVYFPQEAVQRIAYKYMEKKYTDQANIEHNSYEPIKDVFVVESWLVKDPKKDKSLIYMGEEMPVGTWMVSMKIKNKDVWDNYIKTGLVKGLSVEGFFADQLVNKLD